MKARSGLARGDAAPGGCAATASSAGSCRSRRRRRVHQLAARRSRGSRLGRHDARTEAAGRRGAARRSVDRRARPDRRLQHARRPRRQSVARHDRGAAPAATLGALAARSRARSQPRRRPRGLARARRLGVDRHARRRPQSRDRRTHRALWRGRWTAAAADHRHPRGSPRRDVDWHPAWPVRARIADLAARDRSGSRHVRHRSHAGRGSAGRDLDRHGRGTGAPGERHGHNLHRPTRSAGADGAGAARRRRRHDVDRHTGRPHQPARRALRNADATRRALGRPGAGGAPGSLRRAVGGRRAWPHAHRGRQDDVHHHARRPDAQLRSIRSSRTIADRCGSPGAAARCASSSRELTAFAEGRQTSVRCACSRPGAGIREQRVSRRVAAREREDRRWSAVAALDRRRGDHRSASRQSLAAAADGGGRAGRSPTTSASSPRPRSACRPASARWRFATPRPR